MKESFQEWQERVSLQGLYKIGFSIAFTVFAWLFFILRDPVDPDLGLTFVGGMFALSSALLWFLGFWDYSRSKGYQGSAMYLSLLHVVGLLIMFRRPDTWHAFGPAEKISPSITQNEKVVFKKQRLDW